MYYNLAFELSLFYIILLYYFTILVLSFYRCVKHNPSARIFLTARQKDPSTCKKITDIHVTGTK